MSPAEAGVDRRPSGSGDSDVDGKVGAGELDAVLPLGVGQRAEGLENT